MRPSSSLARRRPDLGGATETAWEANLKTSVELYIIWEMTGVLDQLEGIDENFFDVIIDIMEEKREDWNDFLKEQEDAETDD